MSAVWQKKSVRGTARLLAVLLLCWAVIAPVQAITLGAEEVLSWLGDPVEAEIEVLQWQDTELDQVTVSVASRAEYDAFKLTWLPVLEDLNFNLVGPNSRGEVRVLISTREPVSEPYIDLLLVMRWPGGSLLREIVLLFDLPPADSGAAQAVIISRGDTASAESPAEGDAGTEISVAVPVNAAPPGAPEVEESPEVLTGMFQEPSQPAPDEQQPEPLPVPQAEVPAAVAQVEAAVSEPSVSLPAVSPPQPGSADSNQQSADASASESPELSASTVTQVPPVRRQQAVEVESLGNGPAPQPAADSNSYQVRQGDILWNIAQQFQPAGSGENLYQMLLALHDMNRGAFINGNISLLKAGAVLQIPDAQAIAAIDAATAQNTFEQRWEQGTRRMQLAAGGEPQPEFSTLDTGAGTGEAEAVADAQPAEALRSEDAPVVAAGGLLAPADAVVVLAPDEQDSPSAGPFAEPDADTLSAADATDAVVPTQEPGAEGAGVDDMVSATEAPSTDSTDRLAETAAAMETAAREEGAAGDIAAASATDEPLVTGSPLAPAIASGTGSDNPYLDRINDSARELEGLFEARSMQIARLEDQLVQMRIRMREAEQLATELGDSLQVLIAERQSRTSSYRRNTMILAGFSGMLLLTVALGTLLIVRLLALTRTQRQGLERFEQESRDEPVFNENDASQSSAVQYDEVPEAEEPTRAEAISNAEYSRVSRQTDSHGMEITELNGDEGENGTDADDAFRPSRG